MNKKFLFILPFILLTSCSDFTNNTSRFNLLDENKFYKVILYEDLYSSTGVEYSSRDSIHSFYMLFSEVTNENLLIKDKNYSVEDFDALAKTNFGYITNIYLKQEYEFHYDLIDYTFFVKQNDEVFAYNGNETNYNFMFLRS